MMISRHLAGLGTVDCPPPALVNPGLPSSAITGGSGTLAANFSYEVDCAGTIGNAIITNNNLYARWKNDLNNAQLNGQPAPPCPAYQQPDCAAIQASLAQSQASGKAVDSSSWVTNAAPAPVYVSPSPVLANPVSSSPILAAQTPQPSTSATSGGIVPAAAIAQPVPANFYTGVQPSAVTVNPSTAVSTTAVSSTIFGLPSWAVLGAAAVGAFLFLGGRR